MEIYGIRHDFPEPIGFSIRRPKGRPDYTFIQFLTEASVEVAGQRMTAQPGACVFYSPGAAQYFEALTPFLHNWMHADASLHLHLQQYGLPENTLFYPHNPSFISEIFNRMEAEYFSAQPGRDTLLDAYMTEFLVKLSRELTGRHAVVAADSEHLRNLRALRQKLLEHPEVHLTVEQMAAYMSLSPSRFHTVYRAYFGTSPVKDMIFARIHRAKHILETDADIKIYMLAHALGYGDQFSFIRQFRTVTGMSPERFRRTYGAQSHVYDKDDKENDKMH